MSIPFIDRVISNWSDPEYSGFNEVLPRTEFRLPTMDSEILEKMKLDIEQVQYLEPVLKSINTYSKNRQGLADFLSDRNFKVAHPNDKIRAYKIPGGDNPNEYETLRKFLNMDMEYILQIAFGSGSFVVEMLENTKAYVLTHSLYRFEHSWYAKMFIDYNYPNRHLFYMGNTLATIKTMEYSSPNIKVDLIHYAGSRQYQDVYDIIKDCKKWSHPDTVIIITAVVPHRAWGHGPYIGMNKLLKDGIVTFIEHVKVPGFYGEYTNGLAILKYNFDENIPPKFSSSSYLNNKKSYNTLPLNIIKEIEIEIPLHELIYHIRNSVNNDTRLNLDMVIYYVKKFIKEKIPLSDALLKDLKQYYGVTVDNGQVKSEPI